MPYLDRSGIRGELDFTTQHVARPTNENDRKIYKIAVERWLNEHHRLNYAQLPAELQTHRNKETFLNRFNVVDPYGCSHTVVAHIAMGRSLLYLSDIKSDIGNGSLHYGSGGCPSPVLSGRLLFRRKPNIRLQTIGNAVPVVLAQRIAEAIKKML